MTISEMHIWFRQYAQQMGMQNVRAILPEQIDIVINTAIQDVVNQIVRNALTPKKDSLQGEEFKLKEINAIRTLYKTEEVRMSGNNSIFSFLSAESNIGKVFTTRFTDYHYLISLAIQYNTCTVGYKNADTINVVYTDDHHINFFPVRIIKDSYVAETVNDAILKPTLKAPVAVIHDNTELEIFIDKFKYDEDTESYKLPFSLIPRILRVSYVAKPAVVNYQTPVNCDLPDNIQIEVLKHAVELWATSVRGGNQQPAQQQVTQS